MSDIASAFGSTIGSLFGGGGGGGNPLADVGQLLSGVGQAFAGGTPASASPAPATAAQTSDLNQAVDAAISPAVAAQTALTPPSLGTPQQQADEEGGTLSDPEQKPKAASAQTSGDTASKAGQDAVRKLLQQLMRPQQIRSPYTTGASEAPYSEGASSQGEYGPAPLNLAPGKGQQFLPDMPSEGSTTDLPGVFQPGEGFVQPPMLPGGDITVPPPAPGAEGRQITVQPRAPAVAPPGGAAPTDGAPPVQPPEPPEIGPGSAAASQGSGLAGIIASLLGASNPWIPGLSLAMRTTPAETGELPPGGYKGDTSSFVPPDPNRFPHDPVGKPPTKDEYEKWLKDQGDPPKEAKKKADKSTPEKRKKDMGAKPGADQLEKGKPAYWVDEKGNKHPIQPGGDRPPGQSDIVRDAAGMQSVPPMLGQLARLALPLLMGGLAGGAMGGMFGGRHGFRGFPFGRGGHGRFGGARGWAGGHPGGFGSGAWPYHHPGMGWAGFNHHPGGEWRPLHPAFGPRGELWRHGLPYQPPQQGGIDPTTAALLQAALSGGQQKQQGQQQQGQVGPTPPERASSSGSFDPGATPTTGAIPGVDANQVDAEARQVAQDNGIDPNVFSRFVGAESSFGQNYTNRRDTNGYPSYGPLQLNMAPGAMGDQFQRETGLNPSDPSTWKEQLRWVGKKIAQGGWTPWTTTMNNLGYNQWTGIDRNFAKKTPTGDTKQPQEARGGELV